MGTNGYTGQLKGPFSMGENLYGEMKAQMCLPLVNIFKIAIKSFPGHIININGEPIEIGKTGILEILNTNIVSLYFEQDEDSKSFIEYMYNGE